MSVATRAAVLAVVPLVSIGLLVALPQGAAAAEPASVTVVHGLRGLVADVQVDGKVVLKGFAEERSTDPLPIPAGSHRIVVTSTGDAAGTPVIDTTISLAPGENWSLVAHLDGKGKPTLTSFRNDDAPIPAGQGRVVLRNTAAAPSVQIVVDGKAIGAAVATGGATAVLLPAAAHTVTVMAPGGSSTLLGAQTVDVPAGSSTLLYLIGSSRDNSLGWLTQTFISGQTSAPAGVPTGTSGLKDTPPSQGSVTLLAVLLLVAARSTQVASRRLG